MFPPSHFNFENFLWARQLVLSRSFQGGNGLPVMLPSADMFNHACDGVREELSSHLHALKSAHATSTLLIRLRSCGCRRP